MRDSSTTLAFMPRLPQALTRLSFVICFGEAARLKVEVEPARATYTLLRGDTLELHHHGRAVTVTSGHPVHRAIPPAPVLQRPTQPRGRAPAPATPAPADDPEVPASSA